MVVDTAPSKPNLALFRQDDKRYLQVARKFRGTCTREQWDHPLYFSEVLKIHWQMAVEQLTREGYEFVTPAPVRLYRRASDGVVVYADVRRQFADPPRFIFPDGTPIIGAPPRGQFLTQGTTYARWAEGPLFHLDLNFKPAPTPLDDPVIQRYRHQNSDLRELIDAHLGPAEFAAFANSDNGDRSTQVDFKFAGVFRRADFQKTTSLQTGQPRYLRVGDGEVVDYAEEHS